MGESLDVGVANFSLCTLNSLSWLSIAFERILARLCNDDSLAEKLSSNREREA